MGGGSGGGGDGGGSSTAAPPTPRLSTFLRTFGTSSSRDDTWSGLPGVDVEHETSLRQSILNERIRVSSGGEGGASGSGSSSHGARGGSVMSSSSQKSQSQSQVRATDLLARLVCTPEENPNRPPKHVTDALQSFLQSVVAITGGDTLLPDQARDTAFAAFTAVEAKIEKHESDCKRLLENVPYANDPSTERKKLEVTQRQGKKEELQLLQKVLGPIDSEKFEGFRSDVVALIELRNRKGISSGSGTSSRSEQRIRPEYGEGLPFNAPGSMVGLIGLDTFNPTTKDDEKRNPTSTSALSAANAMRVGLQNATTAEFEKEHARTSGSRDLLNETTVDVSTSASLHTKELAWLKQSSIECSNNDNWETFAQSIARSLLSSPDEKSNDQIAAELFDLLGDGGIEFVMQLIEKRGILSEAIRTRITNLRKTFEGEEEEEFGDGRKRGGGSGAPSQTVTVTSLSDKKLEKLKRKEQRNVGRKLAKGEGEPLLELLVVSGLGFGVLCEGDWEAAEVKQQNENAATEDEIFAALRGLGKGGSGGRKILPPGTTRVAHKGYEEVMVPAIKQAQISQEEREVPVTELHDWAQPAFAGIKTLNRVQSHIYNAAYRSSENLLVCAPTGAGKTNIAMMTVLREVARHVDDITSDWLEDDPEADFKIVYVAPMKALAAEVTSAFSRRLQPLGLTVREVTGDTQLSKKELDETTMLVTTPEKWDVITRKGGEVSASSSLRLLIVDEVHLLNDDRGPVIETLIARTRRLVETSQTSIRIVGLSATLPNPQDVAAFLGVNTQGLFVFDQSYRPIPLTQRFIGVSETNSVKRLTQMAEITYDKCAATLRNGKQAMVFVHSRKDTVKTARQLAEIAGQKGGVDLFGNGGEGGGDDTQSSSHSSLVKKFQTEVNKSKNPEVKELFSKGFGCHNAGMLRADRSLTERAFAAGVIKVLVCTATLAWGVNLPAHLVIIKGTTLYDPQKGGFRDLGILDVQQIFGRAGRPGFDTSGEGIIITEHKKLAHYLSLLTHQTPIESQFVKNLSDNLNAELVLGTVTNVREGSRWLGYSYLHYRMEKNPLAYALSWDDLRLDPGLVGHRGKLIKEAARQLDRAKLARFDERSGQLYQTESGRIASHFYIKVKSMEIFDSMLTPHMTLPDVFHMISHADEFETISPREDEMPELERLRNDRKKVCPIEITKATMADRVGKVNLLLQVYISRARCEAFSLVADGSYISQNASRICRALFELALKRGWPTLSELLLTLSKAVDLRVWPHQHALRQFQDSGVLNQDVLFKLEDKKASVDRLWDMSPSEIGSLIRLNTDLGKRIKNCLQALPVLTLEASVQPITRTVLRVSVTLTPEFVWVDKHHGQSQRWLLWVEDPVNEHVYHSEQITVTKKQYNEGAIRIVFTVPIFEPTPSQYFLRANSENWLGCETFHELSFDNLTLPDKVDPHTDLLDLTPLPRSALNNPKFEQLYANKFTHFNAIQTQAFHTLFHGQCNVLLGAPTGSGKTISAELAMLQVFRDTPDRKVVYIAPLKALVRERVSDWRNHLCPLLNKKLVELTGDYTPDLTALLSADIIVCTPEKWDSISRNWQSRNYVQKVALVVIDEIHLLGADRGPILETIVSRMRYISGKINLPTRIVGLSTALANAIDLGDWLGIEGINTANKRPAHTSGLFNFRPSVRPVPLQCHIQGFPGKFYCPRMATMNKPTYAAIQTHSPMKPSLVFVSSRRQTRLTAMDLITHCTADEQPECFLHMEPDELQLWLEKVKDPSLKHCLQFGIGMHHAGLDPDDRQIAEDLFARCKIQVLVCTSTLAWGVNLPAHLVVIKGTEFYDGKQKRYVDFPITDALQMMGRAGRPQFDTSGVCVIMCHEPKKAFYKKFLYEPFPVESSLLEQLPDHFNAEVVAGTIKSKQDAVDWLTWTYFFRRLVKNPSYYDLESVEHDSINAYLSKVVEDALKKLSDAKCLVVEDGSDTIVPLTLGRVASFYYLQHATVSLFANSMHEKNSSKDLLEILTNAAEYDELPVRHNEDLLNTELANLITRKGGYAVDARRLDDPHVKANLLFQAHWLRITLPSSDFVTDAKGALDNAVRVLQAMIDVAADAGWLGVCLSSMNLQQQLMQGRRVEDPSLCTLPGISIESGRAAAASQAKRKQGKAAAPSVVGTLPELVSLVNLSGRDVARTVLEKSTGVVGKWLEVALTAASKMPVVEVTAKTSKKGCVEVRLKRAAKGGFKKNHSKGSGDRTSQNDTKTSRANAPRAATPFYPKSKQEGWWVVLGECVSGELLAMRRISFGDEQTVRLSYEHLDCQLEATDLTVYLISDCYVGLDQEVSVSTSNDNSGGRMGKRSRGGKASETVKREETFWRGDGDDSDDDAFFWENEAKYV